MLIPEPVEGRVQAAARAHAPGQGLQEPARHAAKALPSALLAGRDVPWGSRMRMSPPICQTLLLCDQVDWDAEADKVTLRGVFRSVTADFFPTSFARCALWIELTGGHGETPIVLQLARITPEDVDGEVLLEVRFTVRFDDPRTVHDHCQNLVALQFPTPGEYRLGLHAFGQVLFERRIDVRRRGDQGT